MNLPDALIPIYLRLTRANAPFISAEGAHKEVERQRLRPASYTPPAKIRPDVTITERLDGEVLVYTVTPKVGAPSGHIVYVHGGGWVHEISPQHWTLVAQIAAEACMIVTVPIWTLLPYGNAAQANDLMVRLHDAARKTGVEVVIAGDSAGGQIALSAVLTLRDRGVENLRTVLISPVLDVSLSNPRIPSVLPKDPWLGVDGIRYLAERWRGNLPLTDPVVSPLFGDLHGLGPMLVFSGSHDVLNPDTHLLVEKARTSGVNVTFLERDGAVHVFPLLPTRTGQAARARIIEALRR